MCIENLSFEIMLSPDECEDFLLDRQNMTNYGYDILNTFFENEENRILISGQNHQNVRDSIIDIMKNYCRNKRYSINTLHLATLYLDIYMDSYILSSIPEHQKFVALVTLLLAAKIEENDENIPSIKELLTIVDLSDELGIDMNNKQKYNHDQLTAAYKSYMKLYCRVEFMILESLRFNAIRPTVMTFLSVFKNIAVTECDTKDVLNSQHVFITNVEELKIYVNHILKLLSEIVLYDISFNRFNPSKIAAAMIATTRRLLNLKTTWTLQLEFLTHSSIHDVEQIVMIFLERITVTDEEKYESCIDLGDSGFDESSCSFASPISEDCEMIMQNSENLKTSDDT